MGEVHEAPRRDVDWMERRRNGHHDHQGTTCAWVTIASTSMPGHVDFTVGSSAACASWTARWRCSAPAARRAAPETVRRQADRYNVPRIAFVNRSSRRPTPRLSRTS
jgi:translation elongation factor EF-G